MSTEVTTKKHMVTDEEVDQYLALKEKINHPVSPYVEEKAELQKLQERIDAGEKIDTKVFDALKTKLTRKQARAELELAREQPFIDAAMGKVEESRLVEAVRCKELAAYSKKEMTFKSSLEEMLADQFIACHKLGMKILGQIYEADEFEGVNGETQLHLVNTSTKLMETCQKAALAINKLQTGGQQTVVVKHQNVQVNDGGQAIVANEFRGMGDGAEK